jgi:hypothetical protein
VINTDRNRQAQTITDFRFPLRRAASEHSKKNGPLSPLEVAQMCFPETSVTKQQPTQRNISEDRKARPIPAQYINRVYHLCAEKLLVAQQLIPAKLPDKPCAIKLQLLCANQQL